MKKNLRLSYKTILRPAFDLFLFFEKEELNKSNQNLTLYLDNNKDR